MPDEGKGKKEGTRELRSTKSKNKEEEENQDGEEEYDLADIMAKLKSQRHDIVTRLNGIDSWLENVTIEVSTMKNTQTKTNEALNKQQHRFLRGHPCQSRPNLFSSF